METEIVVDGGGEQTNVELRLCRADMMGCRRDGASAWMVWRMMGRGRGSRKEPWGWIRDNFHRDDATINPVGDRRDNEMEGAHEGRGRVGIGDDECVRRRVTEEGVEENGEGHRIKSGHGADNGGDWEWARSRW